MRKFGGWDAGMEYRRWHRVRPFQAFKFRLYPRLRREIGIVYPIPPKQRLVCVRIAHPQTSISQRLRNRATVGFKDIVCSHERRLGQETRKWQRLQHWQDPTGIDLYTASQPHRR
jgi:hypothetical protein